MRGGGGVRGRSVLRGLGGPVASEHGGRGGVCFGQGLSWAGAVFDRLVSSPWVLNPRRRQ